MVRIDRHQNGGWQAAARPLLFSAINIPEEAPRPLGGAWPAGDDAKKKETRGNPWTKKIPDRNKSIRDSPNLSTETLYWVRRRPRSRCLNVQAGLLTPGSPYWLRLPDLLVSDMVQRSSPVTAAGPSPICTGFPIKFLRTP